MSNFTPYFVRQNSLICSFEPGSCAPNSFAGKPTTRRPLSAYFSWSFSSPSYCGVSPHSDATFTMSITLPL
jgi:hypothetical protein